MIRTLAELVAAAKRKKGVTAGVPCPEDDSTILSLIEARKEGLADFILCGDKARTIEILRRHGGREADFEIHDAPSPEAAVARIVELGRQGKLQLILKGFLPTATLMKPILDKEKGLRGANLLSDILVVENPAPSLRGDAAAEELLGLSDGGLNILPDLAQKKQIVENAVMVFQRLGYGEPKVGIMAAMIPTLGSA